MYIHTHYDHAPNTKDNVLQRFILHEALEEIEDRLRCCFL